MPHPSGERLETALLAVLSPQPEQAERLAQALPRSLFRLVTVSDAQSLNSLMASSLPDAAFLDITTPRIENRAAFESLRSAGVPLLVLGRRADLPTARTYLQHGAFGFLTLEEEPDLILHLVRTSLQHGRALREAARLRAHRESHDRSLEALRQVGEMMSGLFDLRRVLDLTLKVVRRAVDCQACALFILTGEGHLVDSHEAYRRGEDLQQSLWDGEVDRERRDTLHRAALDALAAGKAVEREGGGEGASAWLRSLVAVPITLEGVPRGVLVAANKMGGGGFAPEDREIVVSVAGQTAYLLAGARLPGREVSFQESLERQLLLSTGRLKERNVELARRLEEEEAARQQMAALTREISEKNIALTEMVGQFRAIHEVSSEFGSELDGRALVRRIIEVTAAHLAADSVSLMMRDDAGALRIAHAVGLAPEVVRQTRIAPGEGIAGWVAQEGKPLLIRDAAGFARARPDRIRYYTNSLLCVPLKVKGKTVGVLSVTNRAGGAPFEEKDLNLLIILGNHAALALENSRLVKALRDNYFDTIKALVNAVEAKDSWTRDHSENVTRYALKIADRMGLSERQREILRYGGVLHDIGKIVISSEITDKPGGLSEEEWERMREHPLIGERILDPISFLEPVKVCIRAHHERLDGTGYPFRLSGDQITLETRILSVADAFDAMTHSRPYRRALSLESASEELRRAAGTQFDPRVVEGMLEVVAAEGLGMLRLH